MTQSEYDTLKAKAKGKLLRLAAAAVLGLFGLIYGFAGVTSIEPGEVGILVKTLGSNTGIQQSVLGAGTTWIEPFSYDVRVYDARLTQYPVEDTRSSTKDGQPIDVDASLEIGLVADKVPQLAQSVVPDWFEQVVYPSAITEIRQATASILSDEIYTGEGRSRAQDLSSKALAEQYEPLGIRVRVNIKDVNFLNEDYVKTLEAKAKAAQQEVINQRLAKAAEADAIRVANVAEGMKQKSIKEAEAARETSKLAGEGSRLKAEEEAKGNLALALAEAKGVEARRQALEGAGGERMVQLEWARQLGPNVKVYAVPTGAPGTATFMDLNSVLKGAFSGSAPK